MSIAPETQKSGNRRSIMRQKSTEAKIKLETHTSSPINHVTIKIDQLNMVDIKL